MCGGGGGGLRVARMTWGVPDRCYHAGEVRSELPDQNWVICRLLTTMALFIDFGYGCSLNIDALTPWQTPRVQTSVCQESGPEDPVLSHLYLWVMGGTRPRG